MERVSLNTKQISNSLTGETKTKFDKLVKQQEGYGNYDIFEAEISELVIDIYFGDYFVMYYFRPDGVIVDTIGTGQGHKSEPILKEVAEQLFNLVRNA